MDFYTLTAIKFALGILTMLLQINILGKRDFSLNTPLNQVQNLRGKVSDETFQLRYQEAREKLGLDDPIPVRYVKWMGNLFKKVSLGLFVPSYPKNDCEKRTVISTPLLNTIQINIVSTILALAITIPLGIHCAVRKFF